MSNPTISRDVVHSLSEACGNDPDGFQAIANRLGVNWIKDQQIAEMKVWLRKVEESGIDDGGEGLLAVAEALLKRMEGLDDIV